MNCPITILFDIVWREKDPLKLRFRGTVNGYYVLMYVAERLQSSDHGGVPVPHFFRAKSLIKNMHQSPGCNAE